MGSGGIYTAGLDGNATKFVCDGRCTTINAIEKKKKYINNKKKKKQKMDLWLGEVGNGVRVWG